MSRIKSMGEIMCTVTFNYYSDLLPFNKGSEDPTGKIPGKCLCENILEGRPNIVQVEFGHRPVRMQRKTDENNPGIVFFIPDEKAIKRILELDRQFHRFKGFSVTTKGEGIKKKGEIRLL